MNASRPSDPWDDKLRPRIRLDQVIQMTALDRPAHTAVVATDGTCSYSELEANVADLAAALRSAGVSEGDRVITAVSAGVASIAILYAISRAGAIAVPVNEFWTSTEVASAIRRSRAAYIVADVTHGSGGGYVRAALDVLDRTERPQHGILTSPNEIEWGLTGGISKGEPLSQELAMLLFTSGSTSQPKGALLTHWGLVGAAHYTRVACAMDEDTRFLQMLPFYHVGGIADGFLAVHLAGGTCVVERFDPSTVFERLIELDITHVTGFDAMIDSLMSAPGYDPSRHPRWKTAFVTGSEKSYDRLKAANVSRVVSGFGMTETSCDFAVTRSTQTELEQRSAHWLPHPGVEVRLVSPETGEVAAPGEIGEIRVRGWDVFPGYLDGTSGRDDDDYFCTGDLGRQTSSGAIRYSGRLKEMIKSGGENVSASEVEGFLMDQVPGLLTAVVVGVPDERWGERVVAFAELDSSSALTSEEIRDYCRGKLAPFKIPKEVRLVAPGTWPLMPAGKIDRPQLSRLASDSGHL